MAGNEGQNGLFASAVKEDPSGDIIIKVANTGDAPQELQIDFKGLKKNQKYSTLTITTLHADADAENNLDNQHIVEPKTEVLKEGDFASHDCKLDIPAKTFAIYRFSH